MKLLTQKQTENIFCKDSQPTHSKEKSEENKSQADHC